MVPWTDALYCSAKAHFCAGSKIVNFTCHNLSQLETFQNDFDKQASAAITFKADLQFYSSLWLDACTSFFGSKVRYEP